VELRFLGCFGHFYKIFVIFQENPVKNSLFCGKKDSSDIFVGRFYIHQKNAVFWRKIGFFV